MPSRSFIVQLYPGVAPAQLPDHRLMQPGQQYVISWEVFKKLSPGALQSVVQVVGVNTDSTTASGSFVPAQSATSVNTQLNIQSVLTTVSTSGLNYNTAGFAAQGWTANGAGTGIGQIISAGNAINQDLTGPAGERYEYVFNPTTNISGGQVLTWYDENNRLVTNGRPQFLVAQDGQGTAYQVSTVDSGTTPTTPGTKMGRYAGVAIVNIPSGYYGWIQIEGFCPAVSVSGAVTAGAVLAVTGSGVAGIPTNTTTAVVSGYVTGSAFANNVFGTALTSGTNTTVAAHLRSVRPKTPYTRVLNLN